VLFTQKRGARALIACASKMVAVAVVAAVIVRGAIALDPVPAPAPANADSSRGPRSGVSYVSLRPAPVRALSRIPRALSLVLLPQGATLSARCTSGQCVSGDSQRRWQRQNARKAQEQEPAPGVAAPGAEG
jgi:hypothetical protein